MLTSYQCMVMNQTYGISMYLLFVGKIVICVEHNVMIVYCSYLLSK